jgi:replication factor C subunit 3/5
MSDYEDDMDVDAPPAYHEVMFNSDNTNSKGKRSAANLPVEAEDTLPWCVLRRVEGAAEMLTALSGLKSTVRTPSKTSLAIKTFLRR